MSSTRLSAVSIGTRILIVWAVSLIALMTSGVVTWQIGQQTEQAQQKLDGLNDLSDIVDRFRITNAESRAAFFEYV